LLLAARHVPKVSEQASRGFDPPGQLLAIGALTVVTVGLIEGGARGWSAPLAVVPLIAFVPLLIAFLLTEARVRRPMLPLSLFESRTFSGASFVGLAINLGFYGQLFAIVLYFQHIRGFTPLQTGLALLPEGLFVAVASAVSGRVMSKTGPKPPMLAGLMLGVAGFAGLIAAGESTEYVLLVPALVAAGFGMALTMPAATAAVIESAPAERAGIASGVLNAGRQAGGAIGVALLGTLISSGAFVPGLHVAMAVSAGAFAVAAVVAAVTVEALRPARAPA
jgi:DHA2 family methylenomycin A resistance protein-like MFS transporter